MILPLANPFVAELLTALGLQSDTRMVAERHGYTVIVPASHSSRLEHILGQLSEYGYQVLSTTPRDDGNHVMIDTDQRIEQEGMIYQGDLSRISPNVVNACEYKLLVAGRILKVTGCDQLILTRDGDPITLRYRRFHNEIVIAQFTNDADVFAQ